MQVMIIERCGRFRDILLPGLHWVWPIFESKRLVHWRYMDASSGGKEGKLVSVILDRIDMREHLIDLGNQTVITVRRVYWRRDHLVLRLCVL